jgi:hypothetical protein
MRDETKWFASEIKDFFPTYYGEATDPFCITPAAVYVRVYNQRRRGRRWWRQRPCTWFWRLSRGLSGWPVLGRLYFFPVGVLRPKETTVSPVERKQKMPSCYNLPEK